MNSSRETILRQHFEDEYMDREAGIIYELAQSLSQFSPSCDTRDMFFLLNHISKSDDCRMNEYLDKALRDFLMIGKLTYPEVSILKEKMIQEGSFYAQKVIAQELEDEHNAKVLQKKLKVMTPTGQALRLEVIAFIDKMLAHPSKLNLSDREEWIRSTLYYEHYLDLRYKTFLIRKDFWQFEDEPLANTLRAKLISCPDPYVVEYFEKGYWQPSNFGYTLDNMDDIYDDDNVDDDDNVFDVDENEI